jgi:hypothetical protein
MPISAYYGGHGEKVMANMKKRYGERGKRVFYATANKRGQAPGGGSHNSHQETRGFQGAANRARSRY